MKAAQPPRSDLATRNRSAAGGDFNAKLNQRNLAPHHADRTHTHRSEISFGQILESRLGRGCQGRSNSGRAKSCRSRNDPTIALSDRLAPHLREPSHSFQAVWQPFVSGSTTNFLLPAALDVP